MRMTRDWAHTATRQSTRRVVSTWTVMVLAMGMGSIAATAQTRPLTLRTDPVWTAEAGPEIGVSIAGIQVGRDVNATGGEELRARLGHSPALGIRCGVYSRFGGFEMGVTATAAAVKVKNEFGVRFPNHGEPPAFFTASAVLHPFGRALGRARPYVSAGFAGAVVSADLDNIEGQSGRLLPGLSAGVGLRWTVGWDQQTFVVIDMSERRFHGVRPFESFATRIVTVGVARRY
jgi:hypothetical protein